MFVFWNRFAAWLISGAALAALCQAMPHRLQNHLQREPDLPATSEVALGLNTTTAVAQLDPRFLSVAIDIANVVGGEFWDPSRRATVMGTAKVAAYDFARPQLRRLAAALGPAYLRVGGTDADRTVYDLDDSGAAVPPGTWKLRRPQWDALNEFASAVDFRIIFTLNAGVTARDQKGRWNPLSAKPLLADARAKNYPVDVWELGNELNVFPLLHRHWLSPRGYTDDVQLARWLVDDITPQARLAGPAVAFWPLIGEGLPFAKRFMASGGHLLDVITWHYYPEQSFRCPLATNRAHAGEVLRPRELQEVERWAGFIESLTATHAPRAQVWLGETGGAQCGGEPDLSDRFGSSLWWVDELGRMARRGQPVVVRQTLSGGNYGLIDDDSLKPNPDYWASLLWRRLMGGKVLAVSEAAPTAVQSYAHCQREGDGGVAFALVNVHPRKIMHVQLPPLGARADLYLVEAEHLRAAEVELNGAPLRLQPDGALPALLPSSLFPRKGEGARVQLPPLSYAFVVLPEANAPVCIRQDGRVDGF